LNLEDLRHPSDIRRLSISQLESLAGQVREKILSVVSENGGHLASSLGVVELTVAILAAYDPPRDKIIWDVGHQCYAYKILTDRQSSFSTLRQDSGISGFPLRSESCFDAFGSGHATTSISAALGYAMSRDLKGEDHKIVAIIGDGALTGGIAWEAVNNAGAEGTDVLVILNDNGMSISPNNGALATQISALRNRPSCKPLEATIKRVRAKMPVGGRLLVRTREAIKRGLSNKTSRKSGTLFESFGFTYIGPVDGHDIELLRVLLSRVRMLHGPILLHVVTKKGKGYKHAEKDSRVYHGVGAFDATNGRLESTSELSMSKSFGQSVAELAETRPDVCAITAAMPDGTGLTEFAERFPERFFNVGIAEEHAVIFAAGLAAGGMKPVVAIYSTFLQRSYDQIVHDVCLQNLPVVFAVDRAGIVGQDGATHQGTFDIAFLRHIPNLIVMAPRNADDLRSMLYWAVDSGKPCAIRYARDGCPESSATPCTSVELGRSEILKDGSEVALVGIGGVVDRCLEAADLLEKGGISTSVVSARFIKPIDEQLLADLATENRVIVTVEEHVRQCGFGSAVLETLNMRRLPTDRVLTIALPDEFIPHGSPNALRERYGCTAQAIAEQTREFLARWSREGEDPPEPYTQGSAGASPSHKPI
jgi:1-deoxy-D-xylulose-5-phosphate synthase